MTRTIVRLTLIGLMVAAGVGTAFAQDATPRVSVQVDRVAFPVTLADNQVYTVVGYLYTPQGNDRHTCEERRDTVQVLLHGGGYDHRYWDAGTSNGISYSYAHTMVERSMAQQHTRRLTAVVVALGHIP